MRTTARLTCSGRAWVNATTPYRLACAQADAPCALCGDPIDYTLKGNQPAAFTVDHKHPLWAGGHPTNPTNWQPAHRSCNSRRGAQETNQRRHTRHHSEPW